ncbi:tail fiber protein [Salmonella enterica subsp. enterica serovar Typhimurium]|uniref:phage tail protein n=1 Tax=Salmonella enterica TaxID=28901 RepID=UPI001D104BE0|nr:phage tail protein [Salmonella enterica]UDW88775.1 tail fiber protein [Salmonella enterica subsp. enterica serovar Typhimurium]
MANLPETPQWESGIYQIEVSDPVLGGPDGISNRQAKQLASRTSYLKQKVEKSGTDLAAHIAAVDPHTQYATKASPTFTGTPTAPTPANGDNSKKLATTEFVAKALAALAGSAPETLDTLKELADALGNDPNFATTVLNKLAEKLAKDQNGADIPEPALFVKNLGLGEGSALPVGVPVPWPSATPPAGWLKCNGAAFSSEMYPNLAKAYPANKLPDLRGEFIRGWDDERGIDPGRQLLEWQKGTLVGGRDDNDAAVDISYMSNGNSIDYGGDKTFSTNYRSDYLWYAILGNVTGRAKAALSGSFFECNSSTQHRL